MQLQSRGQLTACHSPFLVPHISCPSLALSAVTVKTQADNCRMSVLETTGAVSASHAVRKYGRGRIAGRALRDPEQKWRERRLNIKTIPKRHGAEKQDHEEGRNNYNGPSVNGNTD